MIKSITPVITTILLLGGSFLVLAIPSWMTYILLASMAVLLTVHWASKHSDLLSLAWHFCAEFFAFCWLVMLFVATTVMMNQLLTA